MVDDPPAAVNLTLAQARESFTRTLGASNKVPRTVRTYLAREQAAVHWPFEWMTNPSWQAPVSKAWSAREVGMADLNARYPDPYSSPNMKDMKVMLPRDDPEPEGDWPKPDAQPGDDVPKPDAQPPGDMPKPDAQPPGDMPKPDAQPGGDSGV
jgi:hypothetical protein